MTDILALAREQVLERGVGLDQDQVLQVLQLPDDRLDELLALAHEVRMAWCGPEVEVEGIISLKTGGCPEDCHFCSQSGLFASPVRSRVARHPEPGGSGQADREVRRDRVLHRGSGSRARRAADGAGRRGYRGDPRRGRHPDRLLAGHADRRSRSSELAAMGVHRYNHNLETARSYFPNVVTTHSWEERWETLTMVREAGMEVCCGGILGMGETLEQRAEFAGRPRRARSRRGAAELPEPAAGHAVR